MLGLAIVLAAPASVAAQDHAPPAAGQSLSVDSTMGELLDNPASRAVLEREVPVIAKSPQISAARDISLRMVAQYAPAILTAEKMALIDAALAADPAAVATEKARAPARPRDAREALSLQTIPLWPGKAPGSLGDRPMDMPTLTIVKPDEAPSFGSAVVVAPGGGYVGLATGMEGRQVADWFAANGVTAFILSYRLLSSGYGHPTQLTDAERALRWVRSHASEYGIDPNRIGMIGFSAGGHLTAMASTQFDAGNPSSDDPVEQASSRPDFAVLGYAAIDLPSNRWQSNGFIPKHAAPETRAQVAPARNVRADTPPTFLVHTTTDELVPATNATLYYDALVKAGVPAELHIFANGRHGLGLGQSEDALSAWPMLLRNWLKDRGIIGSATN
ncbi:alpha/beta hydrolase [Parafrankia sp. BMG5.11]|nr:alpha/beta hydrolase [Parafrankia sp. BMG5.11]